METVYDFEMTISDLMDKALNELPPKDFEILKDRVSMILAAYE